jgi:hypothetical protein
MMRVRKAKHKNAMLVQVCIYTHICMDCDSCIHDCVCVLLFNLVSMTMCMRIV